MKTKISLLLACSTFAALTLSAGNIVLTGHDSDLHFSAGNAAALQLNAMIAFARAGAPNPAKPVLVFDKGTQLTAALTTLGIPFTNVNPNTGVPAASLFDVANFSAMAVASDTNCGGCDNDAVSSSNLAAASTAIAAFFNAGGGIVALAAASNTNYYSFVPASASGFGSPPSSGYVQTAYGATIGIPAVNGNPTHNFFAEPGTGGVSSSYGVVERLGSATTGTAETIACANCGIGGGIITGGGGGTGSGPLALTFGAHAPDACLGVSYTQTLAASGGTAPYIYQFHNGPLNPGMTLNHSTGIFSGTPSLVGTRSFLIQVSDAVGATVLVPYGLTVKNCSPVVSGPTALAITTACPITGGTTSTLTSAAFASTGGTGVVSWSISGGALPRPLTISSTGVISGVAYHPGTYSFTVRATDTALTFVDKACSVVIGSTP